MMMTMIITTTNDVWWIRKKVEIFLSLYIHKTKKNQTFGLCISVVFECPSCTKYIKNNNNMILLILKNKNKNKDKTENMKSIKMPSTG